MVITPLEALADEIYICLFLKCSACEVDHNSRLQPEELNEAGWRKWADAVAVEAYALGWRQDEQHGTRCPGCIASDRSASTHESTPTI